MTAVSRAERAQRPLIAHREAARKSGSSWAIDRQRTEAPQIRSRKGTDCKHASRTCRFTSRSACVPFWLTVFWVLPARMDRQSREVASTLFGCGKCLWSRSRRVAETPQGERARGKAAALAGAPQVAFDGVASGEPDGTNTTRAFSTDPWKAQRKRSASERVFRPRPYSGRERRSGWLTALDTTLVRGVRQGQQRG